MKKIRFETNGRQADGSLCLVCRLTCRPALAAAPYYEGKTIEVIIPFPVAGGSDLDSHDHTVS